MPYLTSTVKDRLFWRFEETLTTGGALTDYLGRENAYKISSAQRNRQQAIHSGSKIKYLY